MMAMPRSSPGPEPGPGACGICFASSHLYWLTRVEPSHGWFQLDAVLHWLPHEQCIPLTFVLAACVPAGRMYAAAGPLLKQPPYTFQMIAGAREHTILRRPLGHSSVPSDTSQPHRLSFQSLGWHLCQRPAALVRPDELASRPLPPPRFNLMLDWEGAAGRLTLQAPLRHWNRRQSPAAWQIESGPLLWPLDLESFAAAPSSSQLTTAWLHANRDSHVTMSGDRLPSHELVAQLSLLELG